MNKQVTDYIENAPTGQQDIMNAVRSLIHKSVKNVVEEFKWSRPVFRSKKDFAYLQSSKKHVTLGFMNVKKIDDSSGILEGTGKDMRHIKLKTMDDIDSKLLREWFKAVSE